MKRSLRQNDYYHGVVVIACMHGLYDAGYLLTAKQTHEYLKREFLKREVINESTWEYESEDGSTRELTTKEFNQFIEHVQQWAAEFLNVVIPNPNQFTEELNELK